MSNWKIIIFKLSDGSEVYNVRNSTGDIEIHAVDYDAAKLIVDCLEANAIN